MSKELLHSSARLERAACVLGMFAEERAEYGVPGVEQTRDTLESDSSRPYEALKHFRMAFRESLKGYWFSDFSSFASVRFIKASIALIKYKNK